ncbi:MAG TPA: flavin reductase [Saprospiraceae bacterium]|nr:flavin reductase [Saprospiraceae bacterium]HMQ85649.1 flavin reductase [Saprospiraceae bacterium]
MKHFTSSDFESMSRFYRANLINSVSGYKPANLIGTVDEAGHTNLAIFSSVVHLGADPALLGFIQRPITAFSHTYQNILATGYYTINHVHRSFAENAHYTSARFDRSISEFEACKLTPEWIAPFKAPFVRESQIKIGMKFLQEMPIELNNTRLIIGQIEHLIVPEEWVAADGNIALDQAEDMCISGLETWYMAQKVAQYPYAKVPQKN